MYILGVVAYRRKASVFGVVFLCFWTYLYGESPIRFVFVRKFHFILFCSLLLCYFSFRTVMLGRARISSRTASVLWCYFSKKKKKKSKQLYVVRAGLFSGYNMMKQMKGATARIQKKEIGTILILHFHYGYINIYLKWKALCSMMTYLFTFLSQWFLLPRERDPCICLYLLLLKYDTAPF